MWRIKTPTRQIGKFPINPPPGSIRDAFTNGNPQLGLPSTQLEADWFDMVQEEIANCIELSGEGLQLPVADGSTYNQLHRAIARIAGGPYLPLTGGTLSGPGNLSVEGRLEATWGVDYWGLPNAGHLIGFDWDSGSILRAYVDGPTNYVGDIYPDAPPGGTVYGRASNSWVPVGGGGGIDDAPANGLSHMRVNGTWLSGGTIGESVAMSTGLRVSGVHAADPLYCFVAFGPSYISGSLVVETTANIVGLLTAAAAHVTGDATVDALLRAAVLNVTGDASVGNILTVGGDFTASANAAVGINLNVTGDVIVVGNINAGAGLSGLGLLIGANGAIINGPTTVNGEFNALVGNATFPGITTDGGLTSAGITVSSGGIGVNAGNLQMRSAGATLGLIYPAGTSYAGLWVDFQNFINIGTIDTAGVPGLPFSQWDQNGGLFHGTDAGTAAWRRDNLPNWNTALDARLMRDVRPYDRGLDAIVDLNPIAYRTNGLAHTSDDGPECYGLSPDEVARVMPEMLGEGRIRLRDSDTEPTTVTTIDASALTYALINAVKELAGRLDALEARLARA
jgi:hypothetical protein